MKEVKEEKSHSKNLTEKLQAAITYYENHQHQMDYAEYLGLAEKVKKRKKCGLGKYGLKKHR
jgi:hypothetical protein